MRDTPEMNGGVAGHDTPNFTSNSQPNKHSATEQNKQPETALGAAIRAALARKAVR